MSHRAIVCTQVTEQFNQKLIVKHTIKTFCFKTTLNTLKWGMS